MEITTRFTLSPSGRGLNATEHAWSMDRLLGYINEMQEGLADGELYLTLAYEKALKGIILRDKHNNVLELSEETFNPYRYDKVMFLFGELLEIKPCTKKLYIARVRYVNGKGVYVGSFEVKKKDYECMILNEEPGKRMYIAGTTIRTLKKIPAKRKYDKNSHQTYVVRNPKEIWRNKLLTGSMRNI